MVYNNHGRIGNAIVDGKGSVLVSDLWSLIDVWSLSFEENLAYDWIFFRLNVQYASKKIENQSNFILSFLFLNASEELVEE